jgi:hypothetical protein
MTDETVKDPSRQFYGAAMSALREAHRDEFETLLDKQYADAGVERVKRRTPEQVEADRLAAKAAKEAAKVAANREKALATAQALALEYPDLVAIKPQDDSTPF